MQNFISDKVLKLNDVFSAAGCKFITDGRIRYFIPVKDNLSNVICDWTISLGVINGVEGTKYEKCVNISVNPECKSTIRIYTNVLKATPSSTADAEIKYEVSHMTYSAISGSTFELIYKMNQALIEQMREFLEKRGGKDLAVVNSESEVVETTTSTTSTTSATSTKQSKTNSKSKPNSKSKNTTKTSKTKKG